ncbi:hypothetical protein DFJ73DRAFT_778747 [Zopfochytrium polystomum]|nr:hypothetical protein DFJ73DRAFT_778747 [Zopfochytrium polystomum]
MHTRESKPQPPQTPIAQWVAAPQQGPVVNLVVQVAVPADQLMRSGAFQLFAPRLSFQHTTITTTTTTLHYHKNPPPHPSPPPPQPHANPQRHPRRPTITTTPKTTTPAPRNTTPTATRAAAPCPHNRRRSQCVACFELGHGGGSICIHRRRKAGCRLCAAEGRCYNNNLGPRRRIRGPNTYVPPPPPPPQVTTMTATTKATTAEGGKERVVPPASARTAPCAFSVEALCGQAPLSVADDAEPLAGQEAFESYPDGGREAWTVVAACFALFRAGLRLGTGGIILEAMKASISDKDSGNGGGVAALLESVKSLSQLLYLICRRSTGAAKGWWRHGMVLQLISMYLGI